MRIVHLATEFAPLAKVGGLADVVYGLSQEQARRGDEVQVILPYYDTIPKGSFSLRKGAIPCMEKGVSYPNIMWGQEIGRVSVLCLEESHPQRYFRRGKIYGDSDDPLRFLYFSKLCLEALQANSEPIDILHLHDWPVCAAAILAKDLYKLPIQKIVLTVHNGSYSGKCATWDLDALGLDGKKYLTLEKLQDSKYPDAIDLLKGGLFFADRIVAVSPHYAKELLKNPLFQPYRAKLSGILNGIDSSQWNPMKDPRLPLPYGPQSSLIQIKEAKEAAKKKVEKLFGLSANKRPWVGSIGRIVLQKDPSSIRKAIDFTLQEQGAFALLGSIGDPSFESLFSSLSPSPQLLCRFGHDEELAHLLYGALDFLFAPSTYEPCGLVQLIAFRYGVVPIVRATGGFLDTVFDLENSFLPFKKRNGILFDQEPPHVPLQRALTLWRENPLLIERTVQQNMKSSWDWKIPAQEYAAVYTPSGLGVVKKYTEPDS